MDFAAGDAAAEGFQLSADIEKEDAVKDREGKHVDKQKDVMEKDSFVVIIRTNPTPTGTSLVI